METPETRAKLANAIQTLRSQGRENEVQNIVSAYKTKYKQGSTTPVTQAPVAKEGIFNGPTFEASEGGGMNIVKNVAKTFANIPSSAARLAKAAVAPVNPFDLDNPSNIGANIAKGAGAVSSIVRDRGIIKGAGDVLLGTKDNVVNFGKKASSALGKAVMNPGKTLETIAKVGIEDPLMIPSAIYAPSKIRGTGITTDTISKAASPITRGADTTIRNVAKEGASALATGAAKVASPILPKSENIMQRVARISKGKQEKFKQMAGESVGEYLTKRQIFGKPENITSKLYDRFTESKKVADEALASLSGTFKHQPVQTALDELAEQAKRVSSPGALSPEYNRVMQLQKKHSQLGLSMSEINEAKRLYERNIKLDFLKQNLPEGVKRANNIDDAIRSWQFKKADDLGLKNLGAINKETRLARQLADDIGKEYAGTLGNNSVSITDWIMLSGGDPTALAGFLVKKGAGSKRLQSFVARVLRDKSKDALPIRAEFGGKTGLPALIDGVDYGVPIQMPPRRPVYANEPQAQRIMNESFKAGKPQLALPSPASNAQGTPTYLPSKARDLRFERPAQKINFPKFR